MREHWNPMVPELSVTKFEKSLNFCKRSTNPTCTGLTQAGSVSFHCQGSSASRSSPSPSVGRVSNTNCR